MEAAARARVIVSYGADCLIETASGELLSAKSRRNVGRTVCGDRVEFSRPHGGDAVIEAIAPRANSFPRATRHGRKRIVAANLDQIIVVVAPAPPPNRDLIDRYLVAAHSVGVPASICLNKDDLIDPEDRHWQKLEQRYRRLGHAFTTSGTRRPDGVGALARLLTTGVSILVGQSGVGKSSLINALVPDLALRTREISASTGKGRHTTTATTLYHLEAGGDVIDSPGVWEYGIWHMGADEIARGFVEFSPFLDRCRFADCRHLVEPGCGVEAAAQRGEIDPDRLAAYRRIVAANQ